MKRLLFSLGMISLLAIPVSWAKTTAPDEHIEVQYRPSAPISTSSYPGLHQQTYVLKKGATQREGGMAFGSDILVEQDVPIRLRDGVTIRADVYRPVGSARVPAIVAWSSYGKRASWLNLDRFGHPTRMDVPVAWEDGLNKFEGPNPSYWVAHGYAIVAPDSRGVFMSEGDIQSMGPQDAKDEYDVIEWIAKQGWSNEKVGLSGTSMLAMTQWFVAALQPPHLAAIAPTDGASDVYRDAMARGGIGEGTFNGMLFDHIYGNHRTEDTSAMIEKYPLFNAYWAAKAPDLSKVTVPAYVVASWTNLVHTAGTLRAWEKIASKDKWLRVHNTHEWNDYYNPAHVEDQRRFFDFYLKGIDNGWKDTPKVRLSVLNPGHEDTVNRAENEFPLARQQYRKYYLAADGKLAASEPQNAAERSYDPTKNDIITYRVTFDRDTEITGYMLLTRHLRTAFVS